MTLTQSFSNVRVIFLREFLGYFMTPVAYVFLAVFLALAGALTFYIGQFFGRNQADLGAFFTFHPWLFLFLMPALAMRLWAEERKSGTIELLLTLPISIWDAVVGKFLAAWLFALVALALTFPMVIMVNNLGSPDNGVIVASYIGSVLVAGGYLAIGSFISALTKNQVVAFIIAAAVCFVFTLGGSNLVLGFFRSFLSDGLVEVVASFSFLNHFNEMRKGIIGLGDIVFFGSVIVVFLMATAIVLDLKKGE
jgi:ABC-2 type transport system permease protein